MRHNLRDLLLLLLGLVHASQISVAQLAHQDRVLVIEGRPGQVAVVEMNGRSYVDLEGLAQATNGALRFQQNRIVLTLSMVSENTLAAAPSPPAAPSGLSQNFMKAGIEAIAGMREWASPLAYAIQNGYPVNESWVAPYRDQAARNVKLASVAAATEADRNALELLNSEFEAVRQWSDKLVRARESMDAGKYAVSSSALRDDPLSQKIITCGRFLASMLGSASFQDDPSCH